MRARARGLFAGMLPAAVAMVAIVSGAPPAEGAATPGIISTQTGGPGRGLVHNVAQEANWVATGPDGAALGGHLMEGTKVYVVEAYFRQLGGPAPVREQDEEIGLAVWR